FQSVRHLRHDSSLISLKLTAKCRRVQISSPDGTDSRPLWRYCWTPQPLDTQGILLRQVNLVTVRGRPYSRGVGALVREAVRKKWFGKQAITASLVQEISGNVAELSKA